MNFKIFNRLAIFSLAAIILNGCIKNKVEELGDAGKTFLKVRPNPTNALFLEPFTGTREFSLFSLRRDANSNASLNETVTVTVRVDTAAIRAYNTANSTSFELLPDSLFTVTGWTKVGDLTYQTTFAPGEFAKEFLITLNGSKWDLSHVYAMPIIIENSGGLAVSADQGKMISLISIKNKYDGVYRLRGYHNRSPYNFPYDQEIHFVTFNANSNIFYWPLAGNFGHPIGTGPDPASDVSWYGTAIQPVVVFDPTTNVVTNVFNNGGATVITRFDGATGSNVSRYDEATKTIIVHWNYANNPERAFFDTLTYLRPR